MIRRDQIKKEIIDRLDAIDDAALEQLYWFLMLEIRE